MNRMIHKLVVTEGARRGEILFVDRPMVLGRLDSSDFCIKDPKISREHLKIWLEEGQIFLEDLGSKTGTLLNDQRLTSVTTLSEGDRVCLGGVVLSYRPEVLIPAPPKPSAPPREEDIETQGPDSIASPETHQDPMLDTDEIPTRAAGGSFGGDSSDSGPDTDEIMTRPALSLEPDFQEEADSAELPTRAATSFEDSPDTGMDPDLPSYESSGSPEEVSDSVETAALTGWSEDPEEGETRFAEWGTLDEEDEEDDEERTRALLQEKTRILDASELPAASSSARKRVVAGEKKKPLWMIVLPLLVVGVVGIALVQNVTGDSTAAGSISFLSEGLFEISYPADWDSVPSSSWKESEWSPMKMYASVFEEGIQGGKYLQLDKRTNATLEARVTVHAIYHDELKVEALPDFVRMFRGWIARQHAPLREDEIEISLNSKGYYGKEIYIKYDDAQGRKYYEFVRFGHDVNVFVRAQVLVPSAIDRVFPGIIQVAQYTFLADELALMYPHAPAELISEALTSPELVQERMMHHLDRAEHWYRLRDASAGNLYRAIREIRYCLMHCDAMRPRPEELRRRALEHLYTYSVELQEKQKDLDASLEQSLQLEHWEKSLQITRHMMEVIGDPSDELFQRAFRIHEAIREDGVYVSSSGR